MQTDEPNLNPYKDDLPLRANTNHMLVKHYVLDLEVHFDRKSISGNIVLFLEPGKGALTERSDNDDNTKPSDQAAEMKESDLRLYSSSSEEQTNLQPQPHQFCLSKSAESQTAGKVLQDYDDDQQVEEHNAAVSSWGEEGASKDFTLVLDCCDLTVSKVEEVDVSSVSGMRMMLKNNSEQQLPQVEGLSDSFTPVDRLLGMPPTRWQEQHDLYLQCSTAPCPGMAAPISFHTDSWSLQLRKQGVASPHDFPRVLRIWYETQAKGASVRWTSTQDGRCCVYTMGSPINNRALFPCQEPPVAMSTWQATVTAPRECTVLLSGENQAVPVQDDSGVSRWTYYVTMPMPASTFTLAVGLWQEARMKPLTGLHVLTESKNSAEASSSGCGSLQKVDLSANQRPQSTPTPTLNDPEEDTCSTGIDCQEKVNLSAHHHGSQPTPTSTFIDPEKDACCSGKDHLERVELTAHHGSQPTLTDPDRGTCSHVAFPCRFTQDQAWREAVIPHRVFSPASLLQQVEAKMLPMLPACLAAAHSVLGVHPFSHLDILIVPSGFSSLGMASPHIAFLSQSVLAGPQDLCGSRLCHEIAHAWFGLAIGARDWTEEWISEGFATYLEDVLWAKAQKLARGEEEDQLHLRAVLRWRRLHDELQNSEQELQILRPHKESTGVVSESGASTVKHGLNPEKPFMQVHYLKGYFLLKFLAGFVGHDQFLGFLRLFVRSYHGQLVLSQDFLQMLLDHFPDMKRRGLSLQGIYADWLDAPGIPKWLWEESSAWQQTPLVAEVQQEVTKWIHFIRGGHRQGAKRKRGDPALKVNFKEMGPEQIVLLLEFLLEEEKMSGGALQVLEKTYNLRMQDAEVKHRWCELVVKHKYAAAYRDVEDFLIHDQAMGVYLYGELMVHEDSRQQALARRCFQATREHMDPSALSVVSDMIL
ncbi:aminopeptidase O isoform X2 [Engraulis encrasicolus]|uniref:aminopeptidase O isoform X2 n=1 Tax=Engraulis encrasicolus TaxID=184585 RepID=UPI002FD337B0